MRVVRRACHDDRVIGGSEARAPDPGSNGASRAASAVPVELARLVVVTPALHVFELLPWGTDPAVVVELGEALPPTLPAGWRVFGEFKSPGWDDGA